MAEFAANSRPTVPKFLIVTFDEDPNTDTFGKTCSSPTVCRTDLQNTIAQLKARFPGVCIIALGLGAEGNLSEEDLLIAADCIAENAYRYRDLEGLESAGPDVSNVVRGNESPWPYFSLTL